METPDLQNLLSALNTRSDCVYDNLNIFYCGVSCEYNKTEEQKMNTLLESYYYRNYINRYEFVFFYRIIRVLYS